MGPHRLFGRAFRQPFVPATTEATTAFLRAKESSGRAAKTVGKLAYALDKLERAFPDKLPLQVEQLEDYFAVLRRSRLSDTTRRDIFSWTKQFYAFVRDRYGLASPFDAKGADGKPLLERPPARARDLPSLSKQEVLKILVRNQAFPQAFAALALMLDTGIRPGEAYGLKVENIHGGYIVVEGKMGERRVPLSRKAREALLRWMMQRPSTALWTQQTQDGFELMLKRAFKRAGVKAYPYLLRHTTATLMTENGASEFDVQQQLGHTTTRMTARYVAKSIGRVREAQRRYGPLSDWEESYQQLLGLIPEDVPEDA